MNTHKKLFIVLLLSLFLSACSTKSQDTITVASKDFTESIIVGELYKQALEEAGLKVKRHWVPVRFYLRQWKVAKLTLSQNIHQQV